MWTSFQPSLEDGSCPSTRVILCFLCKDAFSGSRVSSSTLIRQPTQQHNVLCHMLVLIKCTCNMLCLKLSCHFSLCLLQLFLMSLHYNTKLHIIRHFMLEGNIGFRFTLPTKTTSRDVSILLTPCKRVVHQAFNLQTDVQKIISMYILKNKL